MTDVARYDIFQLSEAWLAPDAARALRIIAALEAEGEGMPLLLLQLSEDIHALASVREAIAAGTPVAAALRNARVWGKRQAAMERAARRVPPETIYPLLRALARLVALAKGIGRGNVWDEFRTVAAMTPAGRSDAGRPFQPARSVDGKAGSARRRGAGRAPPGERARDHRLAAHRATIARARRRAPSS
jgi:DNA polymerase-3 subunit delta